MEPIEKKENKNIWKFQSKSSPDIYYTVEKIGNKFKCDCPGFWRAKDHQCTHIQQILKIS